MVVAFAQEWAKQRVVFKNKHMKSIKTLVVGFCAVAFLAGTALAAEKTCCQKAAAEGKECKHKCCVAAHKDGKSCVKCNPNKEDLKKKDERKSEKN